MPDANLMPRWSYRSAVMSPASGLSPSARLVLVALDNYRSDKSPCPFPSQQALADDTGMSPRTVRTALVEAVHAGFCERQARGSAQGGRTTDSYRLILPVRFVADFAANMGSNRQKPTELVAESAKEVVKEVANQLTTPVAARRPRKQLTATTAPANGWIAPYMTAYTTHRGAITESRLAAAVTHVRAELGDERALAVLNAWATSDNGRFGPTWFAANWRDFAPKKVKLTGDNGEPSPEVAAALRRALASKP